MVIFIFATLLTISGVGAAFILIPVLLSFGVEVHQSMASALLLNSIAMICASLWFYKKKLIVFTIAIPMLVMGSVSSPICAFFSNHINRTPLLWLFVTFCIIAGMMMLFMTPKTRETELTRKQMISIGAFIGFLSGIGGGLFGVGGGNMLVPVLVWLGFDAKKASATTAFIVIFISLNGLWGHTQTAFAPTPIMLICGVSAALAAIVGAYLMTEKLVAGQVKRIIGVVMMLIASKVIWDLVG